MDDHQLDALLLAARPDASADAETTSQCLAQEVRTGRGVRSGAVGRRWRSAVVIPVGVAALALTGAGTVTAYQLSIPPFVGLDPGVERTTEGVPVNFRTDDGTEISCQAFVEFRDVTDQQRQQINDMVRSTDWTGYGQRTYDALPPARRSMDTAPGPIGGRVMPDLYQRALDAAPGTSLRSHDGDPTVTGGTIRCTYGDDKTDAER